MVKLRTFDKSNINNIKKELSSLSIKNSGMRRLEEFLNDDNMHICTINFFSKAKTRDDTNLIKFYKTMFTNGILISFLRL